MKLLLIAAIAAFTFVKEPNSTETYIPKEIQDLRGNCVAPLIAPDHFLEEFSITMHVDLFTIEGNEAKRFVENGKKHHKYWGQDIVFPYGEKAITKIHVFPINPKIWDDFSDMAYVFPEVDGCLIGSTTVPLGYINNLLREGSVNGKFTIMFEKYPDVDA